MHENTLKKFKCYIYHQVLLIGVKTYSVTQQICRKNLDLDLKKKIDIRNNLKGYCRLIDEGYFQIRKGKHYFILHDENTV